MFDIIFKNVVLQISDYSFTIFALAVLLTSLVILSIGIMVLFREKASRESVLFFLIILAVFFWLFPSSFMYVSPNEERALWWYRFAYLEYLYCYCSFPVHHFCSANLSFSATKSLCCMGSLFLFLSMCFYQ